MRLRGDLTKVDIVITQMALENLQKRQVNLSHPGCRRRIWCRRMSLLSVGIQYSYSTVYVGHEAMAIPNIRSPGKT